MLYLVGAILLTQALILVFLVYMFLKVRNMSWDIADRVKEYENILVDLIKPQGDKPSKLVEFIDGVSANIAARIVSSAEAAIRGSAGGAARAANAAEASANPLAAMVGGGRLGKNPVIQMIMQALLNKFGNSGSSQAIQPGNGHSLQDPFKLGR